jgi:hypothetical protein
VFAVQLFPCAILIQIVLRETFPFFNKELITWQQAS